MQKYLRVIKIFANIKALQSKLNLKRISNKSLIKRKINVTKFLRNG